MVTKTKKVKATKKTTKRKTTSKPKKPAKKKATSKKAVVKKTSSKTSTKKLKTKVIKKKAASKKATSKKSATKKIVKKTAKKTAKKTLSSAKKTSPKKTSHKKTSAKKLTTKKKVVETKKKAKPASKKKTVRKSAKSKATTSKLATKSKKKPLKLSKKIEVSKTVSKKPIASKIETKASSNKIPCPTKGDLRTFRKMAKASKKRLLAAQKAAKPTKNFIAKPPSKGKSYSLDLRVHSPGTIGYFSAGGVEPGPALLRLAQVKGLDIVGLTDYYDPSYINQVQAAVSEESKMRVVPGMDMRCKIGDCEEVYITVLFPEEYGSEELEKVLHALCVPDSARGNKDYCLKVPFAKVLEVVEGMGGVVIPTRLDKTPYRKLAIPALVEKYGIHAFDLVYPDNPEVFEQWPSGRFTFFSFSNAHALAQIGSRAKKVKLPSPGFEGLKELVKRRPAEV